MSGTFYTSTDGYIEHAWMIDDGPGHEPVILGTWLDGQPEGIRPADKYKPVKVTRTVGPWQALAVLPSPAEQLPGQCTEAEWEAL